VSSNNILNDRMKLLKNKTVSPKQALFRIENASRARTWFKDYKWKTIHIYIGFLFIELQIEINHVNMDVAKRWANVET